MPKPLVHNDPLKSPFKSCQKLLSASNVLDSFPSAKNPHLSDTKVQFSDYNQKSIKRNKLHELLMLPSRPQSPVSRMPLRVVSVKKGGREYPMIEYQQESYLVPNEDFHDFQVDSVDPKIRRLAKSSSEMRMMSQV
jgi:hypothetical protein